MLEAFVNILRPTPIVDEIRVRENIARMAAKARRLSLKFRPHFKTHQSATIGEWFRDEGVRAITVSSLGMAAYFAEAGWNDITVAFPFNPREVALARELVSRVRLGLLVDNDEALSIVTKLGAPVQVWIEIDTGYGRTGLAWDHPESIVALADSIQEQEFAGILTHNGSSYSAGNPEQILHSHTVSLARMRSVSAALDNCSISIGDTPSCVLAEGFVGAHEIRPGNFVFFDLMQRALGVCDDPQIALAIACPVLGVYDDRVMIYGGAVHFSKESLGVGGRHIYGALVKNGFGEIDEGSPLIALSQEHGTILAGESAMQLAPGDLALVYPVHSCLSADLYSEYMSTGGKIVSKWEGGR